MSQVVQEACQQPPSNRHRWCQRSRNGNGKTKAQITKLPQIVATNKQFICLYNTCTHTHMELCTHTYTLARSDHRNAIPLNVALVLWVQLQPSWAIWFFGVATNENLINLCKNTQSKGWGRQQRGRGTGGTGKLWRDSVQVANVINKICSAWTEMLRGWLKLQSRAKTVRLMASGWGGGRGVGWGNCSHLSRLRNSFSY